MPASKPSFALLIALAAIGCRHRDKSPPVVITSATCLTCQPAASMGNLASKDMDETSGIVASSRRDGVYFAHNDSGDDARFFAIDEHGARLATFVFSRRGVSDCEDIARGPCDANGGSCLYVGDIGDNGRSRAAIVVYRMKEPETSADATIPSDPFTFTYPDKPHDAETLLVHPRTGALVIVTKEKDGASTIFEAPLPLASGVLKSAGTISPPAGSNRFTAGDVHPGGTGILLRTYTHAFFAPMRPDQTIADALRAPLCSLPLQFEQQGEAIGWLRDGKGFVTVSEGIGAAVNVTRCGPP